MNVSPTTTDMKLAKTWFKDLPATGWKVVLLVAASCQTRLSGFLGRRHASWRVDAAINAPLRIRRTNLHLHALSRLGAPWPSDASEVVDRPFCPRQRLSRAAPTA